MSTAAARLAVHKMTMPAMSPTMEKGNLGSWKVKEGDKFSAGDVLLEVETDKAMMDVEADDDGVMAKILVPSGSKDVSVNKLIAYLAEEGDDLSSLELPKEQESSSAPASQSDSKRSQTSESTSETQVNSSSTNAPSKHISFKHTQLPSVMRLAQQNAIENLEDSVKGTGLHGLITKGDVLAHLGKVKSPFGTASSKRTKLTDMGLPPSESAAAPEKAPMKALTADEERKLIIDGLVQLTRRPTIASTTAASIDSIFNAYNEPKLSGDIAPEFMGTTDKSSSKASLDRLYEDLLH
ncbi:dihydrolipoyllysine-residue acetyltransferase [Malassezia psittaci]|uniref:Dihydrolipoyllysine-residue acetyltransferase n=1 Tax=Malassezia psittaci TaxID=1821823 RepID=A0AAF0FB70_9BASI|nr:dihydrolipoyllysine-residue acetyltransferase [Malassezia psittaci]